MEHIKEALASIECTLVTESLQPSRMGDPKVELAKLIARRRMAGGEFRCCGAGWCRVVQGGAGWRIMGLVQHGLYFSENFIVSPQYPEHKLHPF